MMIYDQLRDLALQMEAMGDAMCQMRDDETIQHGKELINAAAMANDWADAIEGIEP